GGPPVAALVLLDEGGKLAAARQLGVAGLVERGYECLCIDVRGYGELAPLDAKRMAYLGTACAFAMGWDAARAAQALLALGPRVAVVGRGACASQAAMYAALFEPRVSAAIGLEGIAGPAEALEDGLPTEALQPRAVFGDARVPHPVELLGARGRNHLRGESVDLSGELSRLLAR